MIRLILALVAMPVALVLALPVAILYIPFALVRWLTEAIAHRIEPKAMPWTEIVEFKPTIGWMPRPNLDAHYLSRDDDLCHLRTDGHGWAGTRTIAESDVIVFGDSYAFGYGVDAKDSFFERRPTPKIKTIGAPGYNMVQELMLMREYAGALRGKLVVWFICLENDLYDNLIPNKPNYYTTPFVRSVNGTGEWEIVTEHVSAKRLLLSPEASPYYPMLAKFCQPGFFSDRAYAACNYLIREGSALCRRAGSRLVVLTIPNKYQLTQRGLELLASYANGGPTIDPDLPDRSIEAICRRWDVPFIAGKKYLTFSDYKPDDTHWNKQGNTRIAELLARLYVEHRPGVKDSVRATGESPLTAAAGDAVVFTPAGSNGFDRSASS
ncbi:MAG TPA: hypothetical protein VNO43_15740 [Candidatus Eisenbacteria bacterium]|nr:hypothetical protein [Candidatus Eisenbacteria bacterium]